jgi:elongation factor G
MDACDDEEVLMEYLETEELTQEQLDVHMPKAIEAGALVPVLVCNPVSGVGVTEVVDFLEEFAPSPLDGPGYQQAGETIGCDPDGELLGVVFSVKSDPHVGKLTLARIVRGKLSASDAIGAGKGEKLGGLFHAVGGKNREAADVIGAGDLAMFSKVEGLKWGDTFGLAGTEPAPVEVPELPQPMVSLSVVPKSRNDEQKIGTALHKLEAEDPTFYSEHTALTNELVIHGMSDLHLQIIESRLKRRYGVEIESALPRIAYRETVTKSSEGHHRHKKQSGGRGQFGECYVRVRPGAKDSGITFLDKVVGGSIPRNLIPAVEKGVRELAEEGILTHSRVVDVEVELYDGKFHAVDSDEASFKKAGAWAFRDGFNKAGAVLQEPVMELEIRIPTEDAGTIFSDLTSQRRGQVMDQDSEEDGAITVIRAHVPLATVQTYHRDLKSQTAGQGVYTMKLDHYAQVPASEQSKILAQAQKKVSDD